MISPCATFERRPPAGTETVCLLGFCRRKSISTAPPAPQHEIRQLPFKVSLSKQEPGHRWQLYALGSYPATSLPAVSSRPEDAAWLPTLSTNSKPGCIWVVLLKALLEVHYTVGEYESWIHKYAGFFSGRTLPLCMQ